MAEQTLQLEYAMPNPRREWRLRRRNKPAIELLGLLGSVALYTFGALFFVMLLASVLWLVTGSAFLGFPNFLAGVVMIPMIAAAMNSLRRRRATAVLGYLQQAVRLNLPLNRVLTAAARSEKGRTANRIRALKEDLENGLSLGDAIAGSVPEMPIRSLSLIDFALRSGRLDLTLNRLVAEDLRHARGAKSDRAFDAWYPIVLIAMWCFIVALLDIFVAPKFRQIFYDFKVPMPELFRLASDSEVTVWISCPVIITGLFIALGIQLRRTMRIYPPIWVLSDLRAKILWHLPMLHTIIRDRNMTDLCTALADAVQLGYPLDSALERAGQLDLNTILKRRVLKWADLLRAGQSPSDAARLAGMPKLLVGMLASARNIADLAPVLTFVARFYSDRFLLRREALRAVVIPLFTLVMGAAVAMVALSIFQPLQLLILRMTPGF